MIYLCSSAGQLSSKLIELDSALAYNRRDRNLWPQSQQRLFGA